MSVARSGLPHTSRTSAAEDRGGDRTGTAADRSSVAVVAAGDGSPAAQLQLPTPGRSAAAGNGSGPRRDSRARVRELVAQERATGTRLAARDVAAAAGISQRRAYDRKVQRLDDYAAGRWNAPPRRRCGHRPTRRSGRGRRPLYAPRCEEHSWRRRRDHPLDVTQGGGRRAAGGWTRVGAPPATATAADRPAATMGGPDAGGCR
jgi:hypothetical protein